MRALTVTSCRFPLKKMAAIKELRKELRQFHQSRKTRPKEYQPMVKWEGKQRNLKEKVAGKKARHL